MPGTVLTFRNLGTEAHEMVVIKRNADATEEQTFEDLSKVDPADLLKFITVVGVLAADPNSEATGQIELDGARRLRDRRPAREGHDDRPGQPGPDGDPDRRAEPRERHVLDLRGHRARSVLTARPVIGRAPNSNDRRPAPDRTPAGRSAVRQAGAMTRSAPGRTRSSTGVVPTSSPSARTRSGLAPRRLTVALRSVRTRGS